MGKETDLTPSAIQAHDHLLGSIGMNQAITMARGAGVGGNNLNPMDVDGAVMANIAGISGERQIG